MKDVKVKKSEALKILKKNRTDHRTIFLEALDGYKKQALSMLEKHIASLKAGKVETIYVSLPKPEDHTRDYDRAIKMLELSVDSEVVLDENSFKMYIMDDWAWQRQFLTSNSSYSSAATMKLSEM